MAEERIENLNEEEKALAQTALDVREKAYAPYSHFKVGAALLGDTGQVFIGCNVENASFGATICAERMAVGAAVSQGVQHFVKLAIATGSQPPGSPCGICRQVLHEFSPDLEIILVNPAGQLRRAILKDLLPLGFSGADLESK